MAQIIGIDLGTTFSATAVLQADGRPTILVNREGWNLTPSAVLFDGDDILVGAQAKNAATINPESYVQFVKREMGNPHWRFVDAADKEYRPEDISAIILRRLVDDAAMALGEPVTDVVITVPAYFDDSRRKATRDAGEIAGLNVLRLINEPTAAAIAFGMDTGASGTILVYDLGGGTFDATLLRAAGNGFHVIATDGDRNLGGYDFDNALMRFVADQVVAQGGPDLRDDAHTAAMLRERCEQAKHTLTAMDKATVRLSADGRSYAIAVTRAEFEAMTRNLLERTEIIASNLLENCQPPLDWSAVDHLLLVGGSTRMPMVREMMQRVSSKAPVTGVNPDEAVALGAAIVAAKVAPGGDTRPGTPARIEDVVSHGLGIVSTARETYIRSNAIIIPAQSRLPAHEEQEFETLEHHQRVLMVEVTEGDEVDLDYATILKTRPIDLTPGLPQYAPLNVIMSYDIDGIIHIELIDLTHRISLGEFDLMRPNTYSPEAKAVSRAAMQRRTIQ